MKTLAILALVAVPRPLLGQLNPRRFTWREILRTALRVIAAFLLAVAIAFMSALALSPLGLSVFGGME